MQIMLNMLLLLLSTFLLSLHNYDVKLPNFMLNDLQNKNSLFLSLLELCTVH